MKYAMVIIKSDEEWEGLSDAERDFDSLVRWWTDLRASGKVIASAQLAPPRSATTVLWQDRSPIVTDGPYVEAKESVGGFALLDVDTAAKAVEIARSWPSRRAIQIEPRPIVET